MNRNAQAILIFCSYLCVGEGVAPLKPSEWRRLANVLLARGMSPGDLLGMSADEMVKGLGCEREFADRLEKLKGRSAGLFFEIAKYENMGISLVTRADKKYPQRIKRQLGEACPPFFFYAGDLDLAVGRGIGFVGSREMSPKDVDFESKIVKDAVGQGFTVVSGGARGADSVAEEVVLNEGGKMVVFLADSLLKKMETSAIIRAVQDGRLLLLSVVNPNARFNVGNAMNRNKFIYVQSDAVVVVKSINRGGTWSGAADGLKRGFCPVYCWDNAAYLDNLELIGRGAIAIDGDWKVEEVKEKVFERGAENEQLSLFFGK